MKPKRIVDKKLIEVIRSIHCTSCFNAPPVDAHHVKSKKTGGHDIVENLMPLCRFCHSTLHSKGLNYMAMAYSNIQNWLEENGWEKQDGKWRRWK
jgi:5-methylcytosine-specific restriction endonuclease McrA